MFESDSWLDWDPDPARAARDAASAREPYASMSKPQILELMAHAKGGQEWEFLQEFFLNLCTAEELAVGTEEFIKRQYGVFGFEEVCFLESAIELALQRRINTSNSGPSPEIEAVQGRYPFPYPSASTPSPLTPPAGSGDEIKLSRPVAS